MPDKATFLRDVDDDSAWDQVIQTCAGYLNAALSGSGDRWLRDRGLESDYVALGLPHAHVLYDLMRSDLRRYERTMYQCETCARLLVETGDNQFSFYSPDEGASASAFRTHPRRA